MVAAMMVKIKGVFRFFKMNSLFKKK